MSDENYKRLIEVIIPLNHDRYKSYFIQFFAVHVAILTGIANDFTKDMVGVRITLVIIGIVMAAIWFLIQRKISHDIRNVWQMLSAQENSDEFKDRIKISDTPSKNGMPASMLMLSIPVGFVLIYVALSLSP